MSRKMQNDYYQRKSEDVQPFRWMSPEALGQGIFTHKSDSWSFGVLVYEVFSMGSTPFGDLSYEQLCRSIQTTKLSLPVSTAELWRSIFGLCMTMDVAERPTPNQLLGMARLKMKTGGSVPSGILILDPIDLPENAMSEETCL